VGLVDFATSASALLAHGYVMLNVISRLVPPLQSAGKWRFVLHGLVCGLIMLAF
jgi:hypothetical protein